MSLETSVNGQTRTLQQLSATNSDLQRRVRSYTYTRVSGRLRLKKVEVEVLAPIYAPNSDVHAPRYGMSR